MGEFQPISHRFAFCLPILSHFLIFWFFYSLNGQGYTHMSSQGCHWSAPKQMPHNPIPFTEDLLVFLDHTVPTQNTNPFESRKYTPRYTSRTPTTDKSTNICQNRLSLVCILGFWRRVSGCTSWFGRVLYCAWGPHDPDAKLLSLYCSKGIKSV